MGIVDCIMIPNRHLNRIRIASKVARRGKLREALLDMAKIMISTVRFRISLHEFRIGCAGITLPLQPMPKLNPLILIWVVHDTP
jgi:hypothetical protein